MKWPARVFSINGEIYKYQAQFITIDENDFTSSECRGIDPFFGLGGKSGKNVKIFGAKLQYKILQLQIVYV